MPQTGTVKFFNTTKGFGFIQQDEGEDVGRERETRDAAQNPGRVLELRIGLDQRGSRGAGRSEMRSGIAPWIPPAPGRAGNRPFERGRGRSEAVSGHPGRIRVSSRRPFRHERLDEGGHGAFESAHRPVQIENLVEGGADALRAGQTEPDSFGVRFFVSGAG